MKRIVFVFSLMFSFSAFAEGFLGHSLVSTKDGMKRIDELKVGDEVYSLKEDVNPSNKTHTDLKKIAKVGQFLSSDIVGVTINGEEIIAHKDQKFFSYNLKAWVKAEDLEPGTELIDENLGLVFVDGIERFDSAEMVYTIEIEGDHTFFVEVAGRKIWVHNGPVAAALCAAVCAIITSCGCAAGALILLPLGPAVSALYGATCAAIQGGATASCTAICLAMPTP